jgi:hypothetical protein
MDGRPGSVRVGPECVGQRVVVRRVVPGERGPSGGPAVTDVLGVMRSWDETSTEIETRDGSLVAIRVADIVAGKPIPPPPERRRRSGAGITDRRRDRPPRPAR